MATEDVYEAIDYLLTRCRSEAVDAVARAEHPSPENGGPCATCAVRPGSEANGAPLTMLRLHLCVEGMDTFHCHERAGLCRGYIAAANLRGVPDPSEASKVRAMARILEML